MFRGSDVSGIRCFGDQMFRGEDVSGRRCFGDQLFRGSELDNCRSRELCVVVEGVCVVVEGVCVFRSACFSLLASLY